jgi:hypothetical protein
LVGGVERGGEGPGGRPHDTSVAAATTTTPTVDLTRADPR